MFIKDILIPGLKTISVDASMSEADKILKEHNFRHLPVTDGKSIVGMLSDRDVQRAMTIAVVEDNRSLGVIQSHKKVSDYMSSNLFKLKHTDKVEKLVKEMISKKISSVLIVDHLQRDIGIVTTEDLLILLLDQLQSKSSNIFRRFFRI